MFFYVDLALRNLCDSLTVQKKEQRSGIVAFEIPSFIYSSIADMIYEIELGIYAKICLWKWAKECPPVSNKFWNYYGVRESI